MMHYDESLYEDFCYEDKLSGLDEFYVNYGIAVLNNIRGGNKLREHSIENVVKELQIESNKGNEDAKELLLEIYKAGIMHSLTYTH